VGAFRSFAAVVAGVATLAISAGVAAASSGHPKYLAPPGNPAVTQYLEVVPNASGASPPRSGGKQPSSLSPAEQRKLNHLGTDGKTLAKVVEATAPPPAQSAPAQDSGTPAGATTSSSGAPKTDTSAGAGNHPGTSDPARVAPIHSLSGTGSGSSVSSLLSAAAGQGGGGGMGVFLPALMAAGLLAVVFAVWRRRGTRGS